MKNMNIRMLIALSIAMLCLVACNKKIEPATPVDAVAEQQIPPDPNEAKADAPKDAEAPAYESNIAEDILGEWSEEVSEGPTVTYKFMADGKCTFQDVMIPDGVDCTYKISDRTGNQFKLIVTRKDAWGDTKDFEEMIEYKEDHLYFYLDNHPYKYNKK